MRVFFHKFWLTLRACFTGRAAVAQLVAIMLTALLVASGFDWKWYLGTRGADPLLITPGIIAGGLLPLVVPLVLLVIGLIDKRPRVVRDAGALGQAAFLGWAISSSYKAFTGRAHPMFGTTLTADVSRTFQFGFLRGGIFWGWPSSHATVAFAMAIALGVLYREQRAVKLLAFAYAFYVAAAVSVSIHWFSDALAGAIIGTVIGLAVGRAYRGWAH